MLEGQTPSGRHIWAAITPRDRKLVYEHTRYGSWIIRVGALAIWSA